MKEDFDPNSRFLGGYSYNDGTIEFYGRISSLVRPEHHVLDLGAGRGAWFHEDSSDYRRNLRHLVGRCARFVGADVDQAVLSNPTTSSNCLIENGRVAEPDATFDVVLADYVLEHVTDVPSFKQEVDRLLKPGGYFCARTPHRFHYVSLAARLVRNKRHAHWLKAIQPNRRPEDVFPTAYRLNTLLSVRNAFKEWEDFSYLYPSEPSYYWGNELLFKGFSLAHKILPIALSGNLFVFLRKPI